jgi:hypothetical protein
VRFRAACGLSLKTKIRHPERVTVVFKLVIQH